MIGVLEKGKQTVGVRKGRKMLEKMVTEESGREYYLPVLKVLEQCSGNNYLMGGLEVYGPLK